MKTVFKLVHTLILLLITMLWTPKSEAISNDKEITLGSYGGRPTVEISVNGSEPFEVIIDTGFKGGQLMLDHDKALELGLTKVGEQDVQNMGRGRVITMTQWGTETVQLGSHNLTLSQISSYEKRHKRGDFPKGVLSFWALSEGTIELDLAKSKISLSSEAKLTSEMMHTFAFKQSEMSLPVFKVSLVNKEYEAHIDTGSPAGLSLPLAMKEQFEFVSEPEVVGKARIPGNHADIWQGKIKGQLRIGDIVINQPTINFLAPLRWVNVGSDILKDYVVSVDQTSHLIQFTPR